ncbi:MAG: aminotransferase class V-fold PLP-dependent enzyme, partial [Cyclobacteriaceae bacterium]
MSIYLDNAATTPLDSRVVEAMEPYLRDHFGNPSSTHTIGRTAKTALESARKSVANLLGASANEIYFTSGGTEADNQFLISTAVQPGIRHAITCATEHHAVLHSLEYLKNSGVIDLHLVEVNQTGEPDIDHLTAL